MLTIVRSANTPPSASKEPNATNLTHTRRLGAAIHCKPAILRDTWPPVARRLDRRVSGGILFWRINGYPNNLVPYTLCAPLFATARQTAAGRYQANSRRGVRWSDVNFVQESRTEKRGPSGLSRGTVGTVTRISPQFKFLGALARRIYTTHTTAVSYPAGVEVRSVHAPSAKRLGHDKDLCSVRSR